MKIVYYINKYHNDDSEKIIQEVARGGMKNRDLIDFFITYYNTNWRFVSPFGRKGALEGGHTDLAELFQRRAK